MGKPFYIQPYPVSYALLGLQGNTITQALPPARTGFVRFSPMSMTSKSKFLTAKKKKLKIERQLLRASFNDKEK